MKEMVNIYDLDFATLTHLVQDRGYPSYRAEQIWRWLYHHYVADFDEMTNLPSVMRKDLAEYTQILNYEAISSQTSADEQTIKKLLKLSDGTLIESGLMLYDKRRTLCISTQAGCAMGCVFCATGQMGYGRNLSTGEILGQVVHFARDLAIKEERVTNIVMMGMGEPLHNYENTLSSIDTLIHQKGMNLGARKITVSTVGLVPAIRRFADEGRQTQLAVSLHAATDEERNRLIPINKRWPLAVLMDACRYYIGKTGRRLTFEWALIAGENDTVEQAERLGQLVKDMLCHVNLIPLNPTAGYHGQPSSRKQVAKFQQVLKEFGVSSTVRVRRGIEIQAGCGQLRDRVIGA
jgi:23S rRNA (adenine2503-C2)-methyltransferase